MGVNNTGYGLKNFNRIKQKAEFRISSPPRPQPIFELMKGESGFDWDRMYGTFNMGMGFFAICAKEDADDILQLSGDACIVGEVRRSQKTRTVLEKDGRKIIFEGY